MKQKAYLPWTILILEISKNRLQCAHVGYIESYISEGCWDMQVAFEAIMFCELKGAGVSHTSGIKMSSLFFVKSEQRGSTALTNDEVNGKVNTVSPGFMRICWSSCFLPFL